MGVNVKKDSNEAAKKEAEPQEKIVSLELVGFQRLHSHGHLFVKGEEYPVEAELAEKLLKLEDDGKPLFARYREKKAEDKTEVSPVKPQVIRSQKPKSEAKPVEAKNGKIEIGTEEEKKELGLDKVDGAGDGETTPEKTEEQVTKL